MALCEICGVKSSRYVCQKCGRRICESCVNIYSWICSECYSKTEPQIIEEHKGIELPVKLFIIGFVTIFIGMMLIAFGSLILGAKVSGGIVIFPFIPVPIVFGFGSEAILMIIIAMLLILMIITIIKTIKF
ncbi:MAG: hypothetical protein QXY40_01495 [Candidatus Methanomethylicia archaeon]